MKLACKFLYFVIMWCFFLQGYVENRVEDDKKNFFFFEIPALLSCKRENLLN